MLDRQDMPIGFLMELAEHPAVLQKFSSLSEAEQQQKTDGSRQMQSREAMRDYVEHMFLK